MFIALMAEAFTTLIDSTTTTIFKIPVIDLFLNLVKAAAFLIIFICILYTLIKASADIADGERVSLWSLMKRILVGLLLWQYLQSIAIVIFTLGSRIMTSILTAVGAYKVEFDISIFMTNQGSQLLQSIISLGLCISLITNGWKILMRLGHFIMTIVLGYLYTFTYIMGSEDSISAWGRQLIGICVTQLLQVCIFYIGMLVMISAQNTTTEFIALALIFSASKADQVMAKFGYSTGRSAVAGTAASITVAASSVVTMMK